MFDRTMTLSVHISFTSAALCVYRMAAILKHIINLICDMNSIHDIRKWPIPDITNLIHDIMIGTGDITNWINDITDLIYNTTNQMVPKYITKTIYDIPNSV